MWKMLLIILIPIAVMIFIEFFLPNKVNKSINEYEKDSNAAVRKSENEQYIRDMGRKSGPN